MTNPFAYRETRNPLSSLAAAPKALFLLCSAAAAMSFKPLPLLALLAAGLALHSLGRLPFGESAGALAAVLALSAFAAILRGAFPGDGRLFAPETLRPSALYAARLAGAFLFARVFYASTRVAALGDSLTGLLRRLGRRRPAGSSSLLSDPGMLASLTLLFLPRIFDDLARTQEAAASRGFGSGPGRRKGQAALLLALAFASVKRGLRTASAMEARAYSSARTLIRAKWGKLDWLALFAGPLLLAAGLAFGA